MLTQDGKKKDEFIRLLIKSNFLVLLQFMKGRNCAPSDDFLPRLLDLSFEIEEPKKQTLLFIGICAIHQREVLEVDSDLIEDTLTELSYGAVDNDSAYGLLKISFQNQIAFNVFNLDALLAFQDRYSLQFKRFLNSLSSQIDPDLLRCFPTTCFLFTKPFFFQLNGNCEDLCLNMDYNYLPSLVKMLTYSFESDQDTFMKFLSLFKQGCFDIFGKGFDLVGLLDAITDQEIQRNKLFFGNLKNHLKLLQHVFTLIIEKKKTAIDADFIQELLRMETSSLQQALQAPRALDFWEEDKKYKSYLHLFKQKNNLFELNNIDNCSNQLLDLRDLLKHFKIESLTCTQKTAWLGVQYLLKHGSNKISMKFETGTGKTTLGLLFLLYHSSTKVKSLYVNCSVDLCFRDFNKIVPIAQKLGLSVAYIVSTEDLPKGSNSDILFLKTSVYYEMVKNDGWKKTISQSFLLLDEFDETLFGQGMTKDNITAFALSKQFLALTGSSLQQTHKEILQQGLRSVVLEFPSTQVLDGRENNCWEQKVWGTRKDQMNYIVQICSQQATKTPIFVILEKAAHKTFVETATKSTPIKNIDQLKPEEIDTFLNGGFLKKQGQSYYTCLLNETQGRGLDAPTNSKIEDHGGITVIIAKKPCSYQEFDQFKGRTKRLCNKGRYYVALWEKGIKESCEDFLDFHLESAQKTEFIRLNDLLNQIIFHNKKKASEVLKQKPFEVTDQCTYARNDESSSSVDGNEPFDGSQLDIKGRTSLKTRSALKDGDQAVQIGAQQNNEDQEMIDEMYGMDKSNKAIEAQLLKEKLGKLQASQQKYSKENNRRIQKEQQKLDQKESKELNQQQEIILQNDVLSQKQEQSATTNVDKEYKQEECKTCDNFACDCDRQKKQSNEEVPKQVHQKSLQNTTLGSSEVNKSVVQSDKNDQVNNMPVIHLGKRKVEAPKKTAKNERTAQKDVQKQAIIDEVDAAYYLNYALLESQKEMLDDEVRLAAYKQAIYATCKEKIVLDLGCGTGILSLYALEAGATRVIGVDNANVRELLNKDLEKFGDKFQFIKDTIENLAKDPSKIGKVDIIVSEWMGYFLLYENMIDSYILCIETFLKPNGIMIPSAAKMFLQAANLDMKADIPLEYNDKNVPFKLVMNDHCIRWQDIISTSCSFKEFDFTKKFLKNPLKNGFVQDFSLKAEVSGGFNALVGHFEVELSERNFLNTSPEMLPTHWKQSVFCLNTLVTVQPGDLIEGKIRIGTATKNHRNLIVEVTYAVNRGRKQSPQIYAFE